MNLPSLVLTATLFAASSAGSAAQATKLALVFDPEMIDANVAYFEQVTGPARKTYGNTRSYKVDGCDVEATIARGSIRSLRMVLSPRCTFDLNKFLPNFSGRFPAAHAITFGTFDTITRGTGRFYSDCITGCGNAADPTVMEHWSGSRADLFFEIMLEVVLANGPAIDASRAWYSAMEKIEGEQWVMDGKWNCTRKHDALARRAFRDITISSITIGYDVEAEEIKRLTGPLFCKP